MSLHHLPGEFCLQGYDSYFPLRDLYRAQSKGIYMGPRFKLSSERAATQEISHPKFPTSLDRRSNPANFGSRDKRATTRPSALSKEEVIRSFGCGFTNVTTVRQNS